MLSVAVFYLLAVICSARRTQALPLYPDTNMEPQEGKSIFQKCLHAPFNFAMLPCFRNINMCFNGFDL